jgi:hypothetical protein
MATKTTNDKVALKTLVSGIRSKTASSNTNADSAVGNPLTSYYNKSIANLRAVGKDLEALRILARTHGDVSAAVSATVRLANTALRMRVYDAEHQLNADGSNLLRSIIVRMTNAYDYTQGFDDRASLASAVETLLRSVPLTGACAMELVLDKQRLPYRLQPASVESLRFKTSKASLGSTYKVVPFQAGQNGDIDLDISTFFYAALDADPDSAYPYSPMEPGLNSAVYHSEVVEDIRRVIKRSGHSRLVVRLLTERLLKAAPIDVKSDPAKLSEWVEKTRQAVQTEIENLNPESALVFFDTIEAEYLNSEIGASADYKPFLETLDSLLATALKTPAAIVGKRTTGGSQNTSSTESLLFIKTAEGIRQPVETVLSRALTLAVRLYGFEGYVVCEFDPIDLRPDIELSAFKLMEQQLILEQLSLGFVTDDEAGELLHTGPRAPTAPKLSGTMFTVQQATEAPSPNSDPARTALTPSTPKAAGGKDNKNRN